VGRVIAEGTPLMRTTQILEDEAADALAEGVVVQNRFEQHAANCFEPLGVCVSL
jgi:hypothetical protein